MNHWGSYVLGRILWGLGELVVPCVFRFGNDACLGVHLVRCVFRFWYIVCLRLVCCVFKFGMLCI